MRPQLLAIFLLFFSHPFFAQDLDLSCLQEKPIVVIIPSYNNERWCKRNVESVLSQNYENYYVIYIDDCSTDRTNELVHYLTSEHDQGYRFTIIRNKTRRGALANLYNTIHSCDDDCIIMALDGDDWFAHENVLARVNQEYADPDVWLTYGQLQFWPRKRKVPYSHTLTEEIVQERGGIRKCSGIATHLRTFYAWLFKQIKLEDLLYNGGFYPCTWDKAMMAPMMEMAKLEHIRFIPDVLCIYNFVNPLSDATIYGAKQHQVAEQIYKKCPYQPLKKPILPVRKPKIYNADLVIFSYDRPLQLYALLESVQKYVTGIGQATVIYRASNDEYDSAYQKVRNTFSYITFLKQGENPAQDFKPLTLKATFNAPNEYVLFAVDDIVVKDYIDIAECIQALEQTKAYGFYLRLGKNLSECYPLQCAQKVPPMVPLHNTICSWQFMHGHYDWHYPNTVDMTIYRKKDIAHDLNTINYRSPNILEAQWNSRARVIYPRIGLCYAKTKIVNLPLNRVQQDCKNRNMNIFSPSELLASFNDELKMDIDLLFNINNKGAHMEYEPQFIAR